MYLAVYVCVFLLFISYVIAFVMFYIILFSTSHARDDIMTVILNLLATAHSCVAHISDSQPACHVTLVCCSQGPD